MNNIKIWVAAVAALFVASFVFAGANSPAGSPAGSGDGANINPEEEEIIVLNGYKRVKTGIEVLRENGFEILRGKKVALATNPSGVDADLVSTADILHRAPEVDLVALFAPEHGIRGNIYAGSEIPDTKDRATGLPVYSLYGKTKKPSPAQLSGIDVVVYDIQDTGCRSYTFISTLGLLMEACAENGVELVVLDRPNPLGGLKVEGPLVEPDCVSFISQFPIPYIYGLTPGELAIYFNEEGLLWGGNASGRKCKLSVVPMEGWCRDMVYAETRLPWVLPSPHIPTAETSFYYPASGIIGELSGFLSIGIGYTLPFQLFGAAWITDAEEFTKNLNALELPGVRFRPIVYNPYYGGSANKTLNGAQLYFTDYSAARLTEIQFYAMQVAVEMYPQRRPLSNPDGKYRMFDLACGTKEIRLRLSKDYKADAVIGYWRKDEEAFRKASSKYYLY